MEDDLFPAVSSTAAKTEMTLGVRRRLFTSLQDRCRASIVRRMAKLKGLDQVHDIEIITYENP